MSEIIEITREKIIFHNGKPLHRKVSERKTRKERVEELKREFGINFKTVEFNYNHDE